MRKIGEIKNHEKPRVAIGFTELIRKLVQFKIKGSSKSHYAQFELELLPNGALSLSKVEVFTSCNGAHFNTKFCEAFKSGILTWLGNLQQKGNNVEELILSINEIILDPKDADPQSFKLAVVGALNLVGRKRRLVKRKTPFSRVVDFKTREKIYGKSRKVS